MTKNLVQQLTDELAAQTGYTLHLMKRERVLRQIIEELFTIAKPGPVKNALWARYQGVISASSQPANDASASTFGQAGCKEKEESEEKP